MMATEVGETNVVRYDGYRNGRDQCCTLMMATEMEETNVVR